MGHADADMTELIRRSAAKGVTYGNLIRLGVLWGKGQGAFEKGTFGQAWGCHPPHRIAEIYGTLCEKLDRSAKDPYSPFDSLSVLIGDKNARKFCTKGPVQYQCRRSSSNDADVIEIM
jgi:hypothetical protein